MTLTALLLIVGATARLVRLAQHDTILDRPRRVLTDRSRLAAALAGCEWCLSIWAGALVAGSWAVAGDSRWWQAAAACLAASLVTGLLAPALEN